MLVDTDSLAGENEVDDPADEKFFMATDEEDG